MLLGFARISKADRSQSLDLQRDAIAAAGAAGAQAYEDRVSGKI
ncbi:MAG: recombinase family protein, partial [Pseudomonadota bacterium]